MLCCKRDIAASPPGAGARTWEVRPQEGQAWSSGVRDLNENWDCIGCGGRSDQVLGSLHVRPVIQLLYNSQEYLQNLSGEMLPPYLLSLYPAPLRM